MEVAVREQNLDSDLQALLDDFELNPAVTAKSIRTLARSEPGRFMDFCLKSFQKTDLSPGLHCMGATLVQNPSLVRRVLELSDQPREVVVGLVLRLMQCDPSFDLKMLQAVRNRGGNLSVNNATIVWAIDILDAVSVYMRIVPLIREMLDDPDPRIRSKAVILIGRRTQNLDWAKTQMLSDQPRVRANVVETLVGLSSPAARQLMWSAVADVDNRVMANALVGLHGLGDTGALPHIFNMAKRAESKFRNSAAWVMGSVGDARFCETLVKLMRQDSEPLVRKNAFLALKKIKVRLNAGCTTPELRMTVLAFQMEQDNADLVVVVQDREGNVPKRISPTSWILTESDVVPGYSVEELGWPGPLSVAFLTAGSEESNSSDVDSASEGIRRCLRLRHPGDRWAISKFKPASEDSSHAGFEISNERVLHLKHTRTTSTQDAGAFSVFFSCSVPEIHGKLAADPLRAGQTAAEAVEKSSLEVLTSRMLPGEKQHLICLGPAGLEGLLEESVALIAKDSQVTIHVIALPDHARAAELRTLAESTGGYFVVAPDTAGIPQLCEAIYTALRHRHHLRWLGTSNCFTVRLCEGPHHAIAHWPDDQHRVTSHGDNSSAGRLPQTGFSFETEIDRNGASDDCGCSAAGPDFPSTL